MYKVLMPTAGRDSVNSQTISRRTSVRYEANERNGHNLTDRTSSRHILKIDYCRRESVPFGRIDIRKYARMAHSTAPHPGMSAIFCVPQIPPSVQGRAAGIMCETCANSQRMRRIEYSVIIFCPMFYQGYPHNKKEIPMRPAPLGMFYARTGEGPLDTSIYHRKGGIP